MKTKQPSSPVAVDPILDRALGAIGIQPEAVEQFLSGNKKGTRIAANALSLTRVALGYIAIRNYEKAREKGNKKDMATSMFVLGLIMATDAFDGYISRKAHISASKSGKIIDSVSDVFLRVALAQSSLSENDKLAAIRGVGELLVASTAVPDILEGKYTSTSLGKMKVNADAVAIISTVLKDMSPGKTPVSTSLQTLHDVARSVSAALAVSDGVKRLAKKGFFQKS